MSLSLGGGEGRKGGRALCSRESSHRRGRAKWYAERRTHAPGPVLHLYNDKGQYVGNCARGRDRAAEIARPSTRGSHSASTIRNVARRSRLQPEKT